MLPPATGAVPIIQPHEIALLREILGFRGRFKPYEWKLSGDLTCLDECRGLPRYLQRLQCGSSVRSLNQSIGTCNSTRTTCAFCQSHQWNWLEPKLHRSARRYLLRGTSHQFDGSRNMAESS